MTSLLEYAATIPNARARGIVEVFAGSNPLMELLHFISVGDALAYEYAVEASLGAATWRAHGDTIVADNGVVNPATETLSLLSRLAKIDNQFFGNDARRVAAMSRAARALSGTWLKSFFDGDTGANAKEMSGLNLRLAGSSCVFPAVDAAGSATNGGFLDTSLTQLKQMIDHVKGPKSERRLLMSIGTRRLLSDAVIATGGGNQTVVFGEGGGQFRSLVRTFEEIEIVIIEDDAEGNEILAHDETVGTDNATASIYCVWFGQQDEMGLNGLHRGDASGTFIADPEWSKNNTQWERLMEGRVGIALHHPRSAARMTGIKNALSV